MSKIIHGYTKLVKADFTQRDAAGVTNVFTDTINGIHMSSTNTGGGYDRLSCLTKAAPATPYSITAHFKNYSVTQANCYKGYGMCWRQNSNGYIHSFHSLDYNANSGYTFFSKWTDTVTKSNYSYKTAELWSAEWFRIVDDGTYRKSYYSTDGVNWVEEHSIGRTDFITADQVGICIDSYYSGSIALIFCDHFKVDYSG